MRDRFAIRSQSLEQPVAELSGGNQQKALIARWLLRDVDVLLVDEPTRGIDVGAKQAIHDAMRDLADRGKALVVVSSELRELWRCATASPCCPTGAWCRLRARCLRRGGDHRGGVQRVCRPAAHGGTLRHGGAMSARVAPPPSTSA